MLPDLRGGLTPVPMATAMDCMSVTCQGDGTFKGINHWHARLWRLPDGCGGNALEAEWCR